MRTFLLNKLVRDKILPDMQRKGQRVSYHKLNDAEYLEALAAKLVEESKELQVANKDKALTELADVLEVTEALTIALGSSSEELKKVQAGRKDKRGAFTDRIYVEKVELADTDEWVSYYTNEPEKYKELQ